LANTVSADAVESLKQKHAEELQVLRAQAAQVQELETKLAKVRGAESSLWLEFDRQLAEEKRILSAKYDSEVNELCTTLESKVESRDAQINELGTLRKLDSERHDKEIGVWRARDRKLQSGCWGWKRLFMVYFPSCFSALALSRHLLIL
jgi:signal transduction histidine kinase